jgi:hypothetical protein
VRPARRRRRADPAGVRSADPGRVKAARPPRTAKVRAGAGRDATRGGYFALWACAFDSIVVFASAWHFTQMASVGWTRPFAMAFCSSFMIAIGQ